MVVGEIGEFVEDEVGAVSTTTPAESVDVEDVTYRRCRAQRREVGRLRRRAGHAHDLVPGVNEERDEPQTEDSRGPSEEDPHIRAAWKLVASSGTQRAERGP